MEISNKINIEGKSLFLPDKSSLENSVYFFVYNIKIKNQSSEEVRLLSRYWNIKDANGNIDVAEGEGVVGEQPILRMNESYRYTSFCPLKTVFGSMSGFYTFVKKNGDKFKSEIPEFGLITPDNIN